MSPVFPIALALYAAACALFLGQIAVGPERSGAAQLGGSARVLLAAAFVCHALDIGIACVHGAHPASSAREALSFIAWLIVGSYLALSWRHAMPLAGALLVPVAVVLEVAARVSPSRTGPHAASQLLASVHILLATAGVALFAVAAGEAVIYLLAEGQLKGRFRLPLGNLPSLEALDRFNRRCIQLGFPLYTFALVTGAMWVSRLPPTDGASRLLTPQYALSVLAWLLYAGLLLFRFLLGWRGRRAALVTLGGFAASLTVVIIYFVRDILHPAVGA